MRSYTDFMKMVGERRALASSVLIFYAFLYVVAALLGPMPEWTTAYLAMAGVYGLAFVAVVAGYFWARWYAIGVGLSGAISAAMGIWQIGPEPILLIFGGTHLAVTLVLSGEVMRSPFEGQEQWRSRFHMDEFAVRRLGRSVVRASIGLPYILLYALAPKPGSSLLIASALLAMVGLAGLIRLRSWGVFAIGAAASAAGAAVCMGALELAPVAAMLAAAVAPFAGPFSRALRSR